MIVARADCHTETIAASCHSHSLDEKPRPFLVGATDFNRRKACVILKLSQVEDAGKIDRYFTYYTLVNQVE